MMYIICYICIAFIAQMIIYKFIRYVDFKERKKLKNWENTYINEYVEMWKTSHFDQLVIDRKIELYEKKKKEELKKIKDDLKKVKIEDSFEEFYNEEVNQAEDRLKEKEENE